VAAATWGISRRIARKSGASYRQANAAGRVDGAAEPRGEDMVGLVLQGALLGIGATVLFDLWQFGLARATGLPAPNWAPAGRWFRQLGEGRVFHEDIGSVAPHPTSSRSAGSGTTWSASSTGSRSC
jgi:hypothetical protein